MMLKTKTLTVLAVLLGSGLVPSFVSAQVTTRVEETTIKTTPSKTKTPATVTTTTSTTVNDTSAPRQVLDEGALKDIRDRLCSRGFRAYISNEDKNVCKGIAMAPDLAYSCVWNDKGDPAYAPSPKGPCTLDFAEHRSSVIITKEDYSSSPPLSYGTEAHCCFRAAQGPTVVNTIIR